MKKIIKKPPSHDHPLTQPSQLMFEYRTCFMEVSPKKMLIKFTTFLTHIIIQMILLSNYYRKRAINEYSNSL